MNHIHQFLSNKGYWRREEREFLRGGEINLFWNVRDRVCQCQHRLMDALEVKSFLRAMSDYMEDRDGSDCMLLGIK